MKIALTGSEGFIGNYLIQRLAQAAKDIIKIDFKYGYDITDIKSLESVPDFDVMVHLAAKSFVPESYKNPRDFYNVNVMGTLNTLELCRKNNAKMIFTSSYVYGTPQYLPIDENHPLQAFNPYAQSKIIGEQLCQGYRRDFGMNIIIIRPFNIYGAGQNENFLIPSIITQAKSGIINLHDPKPKRDFVYIKDLADAYLKAINYEDNNIQVFNLGSGVSHSIFDIIELVKSHFKTEIKVNFSNKIRKNEINDTVADISRAKKWLNWQPQYTLSDGLNDYFNMDLKK
jgi:nucleoside-diphosphate-sugar epimerase